MSLLRPGIFTIYASGTQTKMVVLGGFAVFSAQGTLTILAEVAETVEEFDRAALVARIATMEERVKGLDAGRLLDKEIQKLDHYRQVNQHLQGTAMH